MTTLIIPVQQAEILAAANPSPLTVGTALVQVLVSPAVIIPPGRSRRIVMVIT